jgi:FkbH-like protein
MAEKRETVLLISDFNVDLLDGLVRNDEERPLLETTVAPFGQVSQILLNPDHSVWLERPEFSLIWTRPQSILPTFDAALNLERVSTQAVLAEVDEFCDALAPVLRRTEFMLVPTWSIDPCFRGYGMLELVPSTGVKGLLLQANMRLAERLSEFANAVVLDADRWIVSAGLKAYNPKMWHMSKVPFDNRVFRSAVSDIKAAVRGIRGQARKLVVVDLDDTLWGGIVGDVGWERLRLGGHDPVGESFVDFQKGLKALTQRGILLAIVSKNTEEIALQAIKSHPEMVLDLVDFAGWRINWSDKAANLVELANELNIGLQSVVFIDDNPVERARIADTLSEVYVPEWPENKLMYASVLSSLDCFDTPTLSGEDRDRARMYSAERRRRQTRVDLKSVDDWLDTLEMQAQVEPLKPSNLPRAAQLLNKTNQMNLRTRRLGESAFYDWSLQQGNHVWVLHLKDKYGDSGLTGLVSVTEEDEEVTIVDFVLSCRVMGRKVEETLLHIVSSFTDTVGSKSFVARYIETPKNRPCLDFFVSSGMKQVDGATRFRWTTEKQYSLPETIRLRIEQGE